MSETAISADGNGSVKLLDRIPQAKQVTDLVGQLRTQLSGVQLPNLPLDQLRQLAAGFDLKLPDTSSWHTIIPPAASQLMERFPDSLTLAQPLSAPLAKLKDVFTFDFLGALTQVEDSIRSLAVTPPDSPEATLGTLLAPLDTLAALTQDSPLPDLLRVVSRLLGLEALATIPT